MNFQSDLSISITVSASSSLGDVSSNSEPSIILGNVNLDLPEWRMSPPSVNSKAVTAASKVDTSCLSKRQSTKIVTV